MTSLAANVPDTRENVIAIDVTVRTKKDIEYLLDLYGSNTVQMLEISLKIKKCENSSN